MVLALNVFDAKPRCISGLMCAVAVVYEKPFLRSAQHA
jgi:hypothetical protein